MRSSFGPSPDLTVHRLELEHYRFSASQIGCRQTGKNEGLRAFQKEIDAYDNLQSLQGTALVALNFIIVVN
jgi:hypothetical protein